MKILNRLPLIYLIISMYTLLPLFTFSQEPDPHPYFNLICPDLSNTDPSVINCEEPSLDGRINYLQNNGFEIDPVSIENNSYDVTNPFPLGQIPFWVETHGSPALSNFLSPATIPPYGFSNYVSMYSWPSENDVFGEGIAQVIPKTKKDQEYRFSFYKKLADESGLFINNMNEFYIVLMHCEDYDYIHNYPGYSIPSLPVNSQTIYIESVGNEDWQEVVSNFVANDDYDMVWIFPKQVADFTDQILGVDFTGLIITENNLEFACNQPISLPNCNFIPNPIFNVTFTQIQNLNSAFNTQNVPFWEATHGTPDINRFISTVQRPFPNVNYASMGIGNFAENFSNLPASEGIAAHITNIQAGNKYALSFFIATSNVLNLPANNVELNIALINCQNFQITGFNVSPLTTPNQIIYCESLGQVVNTVWRQVFINFTANSNFNMIRIYPNQTQTDALRTESWIHFAFPELIDITNFNAGTLNTNTCILGPTTPNCSVRNAQYNWFDPNGTNIQSGPNQSITLSSSSIPGNYTLQMNVPGADMPNCDNEPLEINATANVSNNCNCGGGLDIIQPTIYYIKNLVTNHEYVTENLSTCNINNLCYSAWGGEYYEFNGISSISNNNTNIWQARIVTVPGYPLTSGNGGSFNGNSIPFPYSGNYLTYSNTNNGHLEVVVPISGEVFIIEIKLTNTLLNQTRVMQIKVVPGGVGDLQSSFWCVQTSPLHPNIPHKVIFGGNLPGYTYLWTFPLPPNDMTILTPAPPAPLTDAQIEFNDDQYDYSLNSDPIATLAVSNIHGCPSYTEVVHIAGSNCSQRSKMVSNIFENAEKEKKSTKIDIFPNPVLSELNVKSKEKINTIELFTIEGKKLKSISVNKLNSIISISEFKKGTYIIKLKFNDNTSYSKLILKK